METKEDAAVTAWTPGPWEVGDDDHNGQAIVRGKHTEIATCWHHCVTSIEVEMRANARLIAAAPDLFEALEMIRDADEDCIKDGLHRPLTDIARAKVDAALTRAGGA